MRDARHEASTLHSLGIDIERGLLIRYTSQVVLCRKQFRIFEFEYCVVANIIRVQASSRKLSVGFFQALVGVLRRFFEGRLLT